MKSFNLSCHLYLDARLYSEVLLYMDIKWCGWPGLKQKVWFHVCLHAGNVSFCDSRFPQRRIWTSGIVEGRWQRQRYRFKGLFMLSSQVRTHMILTILGKHISFSRFSEGDLLLIRVLIGRAIALLAWKLCIKILSMLAYSRFPGSLLLPEGGRVATFLVCSCNSIVVDLHACTHASGSRRIQSLLPYRYLVTQTLDQSTWQRREQRRPQLRPQHQRRRLLSRQARICSSKILLACLFKFFICSSQRFPYKTLWMQPSGLAPLPDRSRNRILREIFHSLCWRPQTSLARVDSSRGWLLALKGK